MGRLRPCWIRLGFVWDTPFNMHTPPTRTSLIKVSRLNPGIVCWKCEHKKFSIKKKKKGVNTSIMSPIYNRSSQHYFHFGLFPLKLIAIVVHSVST